MDVPIVHQTHVECDGCENDVIVNWYCVTCKANLCVTCKKAKVHRNHTIKPWQDEIAVHARQEATFPCKSHPEHMYVTYCITCQILCCGICVSEYHSEHKFDTIKNISEERKSQMEDFLNVLKSDYLPLARSKKKSLEDAMVKGRSVSLRNKEKITKKVRELIRQLKEMEEEVIKSEEDKFMSLSYDFDLQLAMMDDHIPKVEAEIQKFETQINTFSRIEFVLHVPQKLNSTNFEPPNVTEPILQECQESDFRMPHVAIAVGKSQNGWNIEPKEAFRDEDIKQEHVLDDFEAVDIRKIQFLLRSKRGKLGMERILERFGANINWSEINKTKKLLVRYHGSLKPSYVYSDIVSFFDTILVLKMNVMPYRWTTFCKGLQELHVPEPDCVAVILESQTFEIFIVGLQAAVNKLWSIIRRMEGAQ